MSNIGKNIKTARTKVNETPYNLLDAIILAKNIGFAKFIESLDIGIKFDLQIKKNQQLMKGVVNLPYKIGNNYNLVVFSNQKIEFIEHDQSIQLTLGNLELIKQIEITKQCNFNYIIASNDFISQLKNIASILGPKGLMPSKTWQNLTDNIQTTVNNLPYQLRYQLDNHNYILAKVGNIMQEPNQITNNIIFFIKHLIKQYPTLITKSTLSKIFISSTMGPKILININSIHI